MRYSAIPYKPLTRIDCSFKCQQYEYQLQNCTNESICYKCGETHLYNPHCSNTIKCANCAGSHMAGSPACPVKISYRKAQHQQHVSKHINQSNTIHLPSPARLYSNVLKTMSPPADSKIHETDITRLTSSQHPDPSSLIYILFEDLSLTL